MPEISESGVFIDSKTGEVVDKQPEEGVQLVAPGSEIDQAAKDAIEAAKVAAAGGAPVAETVTTETVGRSPKKSTAKSDY